MDFVQELASITLVIHSLLSSVFRKHNLIESRKSLTACTGSVIMTINREKTPRTRKEQETCYTTQVASPSLAYVC